MTVQQVANWLVSSFQNAKNRFGNVGLTLTHNDQGRVTGLTLRKKTSIRSDPKNLRNKDETTTRIKQAYDLILQHYQSIKAIQGDADLMLEIQIHGGCVTNVSVSESRNLHGEALTLFSHDDSFRTGSSNSIR